MTAPLRFLFDNDFSVPARQAEPEPPPVPTIDLPLHETLLAAAEAAAFERGRAAGREEVEARAAERVAEEASRLSAAAQSIMAVLDVERARIEDQAMRLAEAVGRKIAGRIYELQPRAIVEQVLREALESIGKAPHLVVRLAAADAEPIREALQRAADERGFSGRLVVLGEDGVDRGDCRIEWADGGIVHERVAIEAAIARAVDAHLTLPGAEAAAGGDGT